LFYASQRLFSVCQNERKAPDRVETRGKCLAAKEGSPVKVIVCIPLVGDLLSDKLEGLPEERN